MRDTLIATLISDIKLKDPRLYQALQALIANDNDLTKAQTIKMANGITLEAAITEISRQLAILNAR